MSQPPPDYVAPGRIIGSEWALTLTAKVAEKRLMTLIQTASCLALHPDKIVAGCGSDSFYASKRKATPASLFRPSATVASAMPEAPSAVPGSSSDSWAPTAASIPSTAVSTSAKWTPTAITASQGTGTGTGTEQQPVSITCDPQIIPPTSVDAVSPLSAKRVNQDISMNTNAASSHSNSSSSSSSSSSQTVVMVNSDIDDPSTINLVNDKIERNGIEAATVTAPSVADPRKRKSPIRSPPDDSLGASLGSESKPHSTPLAQRTATGSIDLASDREGSDNKKFKRSTSVSSKYISPSGDSHLGLPNRHSMRIVESVSLILTPDVSASSSFGESKVIGQEKGGGKEDSRKKKYEGHIREKKNDEENGNGTEGSGRGDEVNASGGAADEEVEASSDEGGNVTGKCCHSEYVDLTRKSPRRGKSTLPTEREDRAIPAVSVEPRSPSLRGSRKAPAPATAAIPKSKAVISTKNNIAAENSMSARSGKTIKTTSSTQKEGTGAASSSKGNIRSFFSANK